MKLTRFLTFLICGLFLSSCAHHFQVLQTTSDELLLDEESNMRWHGDDHLDVYYDFWSEGGVVILFLANKTDYEMHIDFEKSHFTINNREVNYYADQHENTPRPFDDPNPMNTRSTYYKELPRVLKILPNSGQWIEGYPVSFDWLPLHRKDQHKSYTKKTSPIRINNHFTYSIPDINVSGTSVEHEVWVSAIRQMKKRDFNVLANKMDKGSTKNKPDYFFIRNPNAGNGQAAEGWAELTISLLDVITLFL